jgi:hypothetical protein
MDSAHGQYHEERISAYGRPCIKRTIRINLYSLSKTHILSMLFATIAVRKVATILQLQRSFNGYNLDTRLDLDHTTGLKHQAGSIVSTKAFCLAKTNLHGSSSRLLTIIQWVIVSESTFESRLSLSCYKSHFIL